MNSRTCKTLLCLSVGLLCGCATTKAKPQNTAQTKGPTLKLSWLISKTSAPKAIEIHIKSPNGATQKQRWTTLENEPYEWDGINYPAKSIFFSGWFKTPGQYKITVCSPKCSIHKTINVTGKELKVTAQLTKFDEGWSDVEWWRYNPSIKGILLRVLPRKQWDLINHPEFEFTNNSNQTVCAVSAFGGSGYFEIQTAKGWRLANKNEFMSDMGNYLILKKGETRILHDQSYSKEDTNLSRKNLRFVKAYITGENCLEPKSIDNVWDIHIVTAPFKPLRPLIYQHKQYNNALNTSSP